MFLIAVPLLILVIWPFHHSKAAPPQNQQAVTTNPVMDGEPAIPERLCGHMPDIGWDFIGPDGLVGVSKTSCQDAFRNWNAQKSSPPLENRS